MHCCSGRSRLFRRSRRSLRSRPRSDRLPVMTGRPGPAPAPVSVGGSTASSARGRLVTVGPGITAQFPLLTDEQVASLARRGTRHVTTAGEVLYAAGDRGYGFIVIEAGDVDVVRPAMPDAPETLIATWGPGRFLGELNLLTGQTAIAMARVRSAGVVHRIAPAQFRELMAEDADVSA